MSEYGGRPNARLAETSAPPGKGVIAAAARRQQGCPTSTAAQAGNRQVVLISGEPGIGKTALVEEFLAGLHETTRLAGVGQCHPVGAGEPYAPVLDALSDLAAGPAAAAVWHCLDELAPPRT